MRSANGLFLLSSLIWGSTWFVIRYQLGRVAPEVSVVYRFALAAALLLGFCAATGIRMRYSRREHFLVAAQGAFMFAPNYVLIYHSERFLASGLVAVVFSIIVIFNILGMRLFFGQPIRFKMIAGAAAGVGGVALLFWPELAHFEGGAKEGTGLALATVATFVASIGNLIAAHNYRLGMPVQSSTGFAMLYGALMVTAWAIVTGVPWTFLSTGGYLLSLAYLAVFGSVVAFVAYLTLAGEIGADRAGYVGVVTPVVALALSTALEGYRWTVPAVAGAALCLGGNVLILRRKRREKCGQKWEAKPVWLERNWSRSRRAGKIVDCIPCLAEGFSHEQAHDRRFSFLRDRLRRLQQRFGLEHHGWHDDRSLLGEVGMLRGNVGYHYVPAWPIANQRNGNDDHRHHGVRRRAHRP